MNDTLNRQQIQQLRDRRDLVGFIRNMALAKHQTLVGTERRDHMNGALASALLVRAAQCFPIDRDDVAGQAGKRGNPGDKAALKLLRIEL